MDRMGAIKAIASRCPICSIDCYENMLGCDCFDDANQIFSKSSEITKLYGIDDYVLDNVPKIKYKIYDRVQVHEHIRKYIQSNNVPSSDIVSKLFERQEEPIRYLLKERRKLHKRWMSVFQTVDALLQKLNATYLTDDNIANAYLMTTCTNQKSGPIMDVVKWVMEPTLKQYLMDMKKIAIDALLDKPTEPDYLKLAQNTDYYKTYTRSPWSVGAGSRFDMTDKNNETVLLKCVDKIKGYLERAKLAESWPIKKCTSEYEKHICHNTRHKFVYGRITFEQYKEAMNLVATL
jgi:hypothetical protein